MASHSFHWPARSLPLGTLPREQIKNDTNENDTSTIGTLQAVSYTALLAGIKQYSGDFAAFNRTIPDFDVGGRFDVVGVEFKEPSLNMDSAISSMLKQVVANQDEWSNNTDEYVQGKLPQVFVTQGFLGFRKFWAELLVHKYVSKSPRWGPKNP